MSVVDQEAKRTFIGIDFFCVTDDRIQVWPEILAADHAKACTATLMPVYNIMQSSA